jgi:hypothetical protein
MTEGQIIDLNSSMAVKLSQAYKKAKKDKKNTFTFSDMEMSTDYAFYLLEYLNMKGLLNETPVK